MQLQTELLGAVSGPGTHLREEKPSLAEDQLGDGPKGFGNSGSVLHVAAFYSVRREGLHAAVL